MTRSLDEERLAALRSEHDSLSREYIANQQRQAEIVERLRFIDSEADELERHGA